MADLRSLAPSTRELERAAPVARTPRPDSTQPVLWLQRQVGNTSVARLLAASARSTDGIVHLARQPAAVIPPPPQPTPNGTSATTDTSEEDASAISGNLPQAQIDRLQLTCVSKLKAIPAMLRDDDGTDDLQRGLRALAAPRAALQTFIPAARPPEATRNDLLMELDQLLALESELTGSTAPTKQNLADARRFLRTARAKLSSIRTVAEPLAGDPAAPARPGLPPSQKAEMATTILTPASQLIARLSGPKLDLEAAMSDLEGLADNIANFANAYNVPAVLDPVFLSAVGLIGQAFGRLSAMTMKPSEIKAKARQRITKIAEDLSSIEAAEPVSPNATKP